MHDVFPATVVSLASSPARTISDRPFSDRPTSPLCCIPMRTPLATFMPILEGKDVVAQARTGSGKTMAFVLPVVERLKTAAKGPLTRGRAPRVLVICPTRELAKQVCQGPSFFLYEPVRRGSFHPVLLVTLFSCRRVISTTSSPRNSPALASTAAPPWRCKVRTHVLLFHQHCTFVLW